MLKNRFNPLRAKHEDTPPPGGGGEAPKAPDAGEKEDGEEEEEEEEEEEPTPEPPAAAAMKMSAFERGKLRLLGMGDLINRVATAEGLRLTAEAEVVRLTSENLRLSAALTAAKKNHPVELKAAADGHEKDLSRKVRAELTGLGLAAEQVPSQVGAEGTPEAMLEKFGSLKGAEKTAFWRANKAVLKAAESSKSAASR